ncbi:hypothetical protein SSS_05942 [Sarcoptes scabiei]|nr:hypothetical protein SSS_05942 [Sarcoptes scabiei]
MLLFLTTSMSISIGIVKSSTIFRILFIILLLPNFDCRKHRLIIKNDIRSSIPITTFGFLSDGTLDVDVNSFIYHPNDLDQATVSSKFGFSLARTLSSTSLSNIKNHGFQNCILNKKADSFSNIGIVLMKFEIQNNSVLLECNSALSELRIFSTDLPLPQKISTVKTVSDHDSEHRSKKQITGISATNSRQISQKDDGIIQIDVESNNLKSLCSRNSFRLIPELAGKNQYSFKFRMIVDSVYEGLFALHFHNCFNHGNELQENKFVSVDLNIDIVEKNINSFLSAGEIPLPRLYFDLSVVFFIIGIVWFVVLKNRRQETFKIHYLMGVLVFVKAFSLLFHSINNHFISKEGFEVETWAILYYITHFLKGALLFITIVLIGTGWAFIKHILSDKDKKIFVIVIPLQVIANIADIITEESEEGALIHLYWKKIFILVDMICCGAILFPVIWSIRHLQEASTTDGKAVINLKKLILFRFFYIMIVFYIYFTRIIVYLVEITVPFNYLWLDAFFQHFATLIFFILTGYHFQPASSNPYYQLTQEEIEMDEELVHPTEYVYRGKKTQS